MSKEDMISIKTVAMKWVKRCPNEVICEINGELEDEIKHGEHREICLKCWEEEIRRWKDE